MLTGNCWHQTPVLSPGQSISVQAESFRDGKAAGDFFTAHLNPQYASQELTVNLHFMNADLKPYFIVETIAPESLTIIRFSGPG